MSLGQLKRAEVAIAGIPQAGNNVTKLIELVIDRSDVDRDVWMDASQLLNSYFTGNHANKLNAGRAMSFQKRRGFCCAATSGQHRIKQDNVRLRQPSGQTTIIIDRAQGNFVAIEPDMTDFGLRYNAQHSFE